DVRCSARSASAGRKSSRRADQVATTQDAWKEHQRPGFSLKSPGGNRRRLWPVSTLFCVPSCTHSGTKIVKIYQLRGSYSLFSFSQSASNIVFLLHFCGISKNLVRFPIFLSSQLQHTEVMVVMRAFFRLSLCASVLALAAVSSAQTKLPKVEFTDTTLENGLRVIIVPEHTAPVFALSLTYNTGSRNEKQGRTGFAHLFEHMMFEGSANVGKGEHMLLVQNFGDTLNGSTNNDQTNYFEELPKNQLDLALFLESDRMRALNITQANLDNQRNAVQEERRLRVDNQPYGKSTEEL